MDLFEFLAESIRFSIPSGLQQQFHKTSFLVLVSHARSILPDACFRHRIHEMDMLRVLWPDIPHFRVRIHHYIKPTNYDFQKLFPILLLFCFVYSFFSRTNGMNSNVYFKSVSYGLIQTIFITKQISGPLPRYEYQAFSISLSLSRSNHLLIALMLLCLLQDQLCNGFDLCLLDMHAQAASASQEICSAPTIQMDSSILVPSSVYCHMHFSLM